MGQIECLKACNIALTEPAAVARARCCRTHAWSHTSRVLPDEPDGQRELVANVAQNVEGRTARELPPRDEKEGVELRRAGS